MSDGEPGDERVLEAPSASPAGPRSTATGNEATRTLGPPRERRDAGNDAGHNRPFADEAELPRIDGYRLLHRLGEGGMGVVYKAEHLALRRIVAVKMIRSGPLASADELARFQIEAEAVARLQHPHIVQVFDFGQQRGLRYLSLEYVDGGNLAARIAGRPQPGDQAARTVEALARAVHAAHLRGIIHRDLKPHNVLLTAAGTPKISDFGLAKLVSENEQAESSMMVGTAGYMAPEQAWGSGPAAEIGPATDVYGLGVILYEMLTGRLPFQGSTPRDTLEQVWTKSPPRPRSFQPGVPRDLETISLKCLEKLAQHRYPSAEALADDLRRYLEGKPILARPAGRIERVVKWGRRRPAAAALAAVSTIALMIVVALASWYQLQVNKNYRLAKANLRQAQNAIDQLINRVSIEGLAPVPRSENLRRELLEAALSFCLTLQEQNPNDRELMRQTVRAQRQMADLYQMLDRQEAALSAYRRAIAAGSTAVARFRQVEDRRELAVACNNMANLLARNDQTVASEGAYQQSVAIWEQLQRQWPNQRDYSRGLAAAKNNLALLWASAGKLVAARHAAEEAIAIRRSLATIDRQASAYQLELATSLNNLATIHKASGQYAAADPLLRQARDLLAQQQPSVAKLPTARFTLASIENNLATVLAAEHEAGQSEQAYRRAIELLEPLASEFPAIGTYRQALADARSNFGLLLAAQGRTADAEDELRGAEQLYAKLSADAPTAVAIRLGQMLTLSRRADVAAREGRSGEAERLIVAAAKLGDALLKEAPRNADVAAAQSLALQTMSRLLVDRRLLDRARGTLEQAREIARQAVENNPHAGSSRMSLIGANTSLAKLLIELGEPADASRIAEENVALAAAGPEQVLDTVHLLAQCVPLALAIKGKGQALREGVPLDEYCARRALELLTALKRQGRDLTALADDPAMAVFKDRPEFRELFGEPAAGP